MTSKYHANSIGLLGSIVHNDFTVSSDVDIIVYFSQPVGIEFIDLADYIEKKLGISVDLVSKNGIKAKYHKVVESEIVYV